MTSLRLRSFNSLWAAYRSGFGIHPCAIFCASAIWAGVFLAPKKLRFCTALSRFSFSINAIR
jgi:hypothetical protein